MRVLITGNMGYVGGVLSEHLHATHPDWELIGLDTGYFKDDLTGTEPYISRQIIRDVRDLSYIDLEGCDAVVHLAAISNDPMGKEFEKVTSDVNYQCSANLAAWCRQLKIKKFVFASSCSVYGAAGDSPRTESSRLGPLTSYGRSKMLAEKAFDCFQYDDIQFSVLRFATACGMSPRLRLDLVLNDFVASALVMGKIEVLSDGTPWRPLIAVTDMARAIEWALLREGRSTTANVGSEDWSWPMAALAYKAASILGVPVSINAGSAPDRRSYRVDFSKFKAIAPDHQPVASFSRVIHDLRSGMLGMSDLGKSFRGSRYMRLHALKKHRMEGRLDPDLRWTDK